VTASASTRPTPSKATSRIDRRQAAIGVGMAIVIVLAAWLVGGRAGFNDIGKGGINRHFLPKEGQVAPDFAALDATGSEVRLSDFRGQPVWLNFWGSWCAPCRSEFPEIEAAYEQLAPRGVAFMSVSLDEAYEDSLAFAQSSGGTFPILNVRFRSAIAENYDLYNVPTHIFIDANGVVRRIIAGPLDEKTAVAEAEALLAAPISGS
jgi:cytochrome c biogenesis protein CcmG/thiol:disulfide interchange protein DsbE